MNRFRKSCLTCFALALLLILTACSGKNETGRQSTAIQTTTYETVTETATVRETTTEETTARETTTEEAETPDPIEERLAQMSLAEKVGQLFVIRVESAAGVLLGTNSARGGYTELTEEMESFLKTYPPGGYCLFADNIKDPEQLAALMSQLAGCTEIPPILCIDEEGGQVRRLGSNASFDTDYVESMGSIGASERSAEAAYAAGETIGAYLAEYGFTLDLAPVADVNSNPQNTVIGNRAFSSDPQLTASLVSAYLTGLHNAGVGGCMKHFPGQGGTSGDTHSGVVTLDKSKEELYECELLPYLTNIDQTDAVLVAHILLPNVTDDGYPASLSREVIEGILRQELGFEGLVITDSLAMGAIVKEYGPSEAAVMALEAGNDILLMPQNYEEAFEAVLAAVESGRISEARVDESVYRILNFKEGLK